MRLLPCLASALALLSAENLFAQNENPAAPPQNQSHESKSGSYAFKDEHIFEPPATADVKSPLNVRGQPSLKGEAIAHLHKGDTATVLEVMSLSKPHKHEPANWARISLPTNTPVWVFSQFIESNSMTVLPKRVNMRGGPGENYSVLGRLNKGVAVKEISRRNGWIRIETPAGAYGFVDADYLEIQSNPAPAIVAAAPLPVPAPAAEVTTPPTAPPPAPETPKTATIVAPEPTTATAPSTTPATTAPTVADLSAAISQLPARIITREGVLRRAYNIQAPADYELRDVTSGEIIDYIQPQAKQDLKKLLGKRVLVTGAEVLDQRWSRTPVLELQTLDRVP